MVTARYYKETRTSDCSLSDVRASYSSTRTSSLKFAQ